jgi:two-component system, NtrC family, sensor histidine kinase PilS
MATGFNERTWLAWLVKVRIIILTFLLGVGLTIIRLTPNNIPVRGFVNVILLWYTIAVFFLVLHSLWNEFGLQARVQVLTDLALSTIVVYITGGIDTSFNFLNPLVIIVASILLPRWWAYLTASLSFIAFGAVLELSYFDLIHSFSVSHPDLRTMQIVILINLLAYLAVAYLASTLSAKLRQTDVELQDKSGELEDLQALQNDIIQSMRGGLITTDLEGSITLMNLPAQNYLERKPKDLLGTMVDSLFLDPLPEPQPHPVQGEVRATTSRGEKIFGITVTPLAAADGDVIGLIYTFADLTEMRRLEAEVRMRERLAAVGRLAAGIAHEIRNPLSSIAGSVKLLATISNLPEEHRALLGIVTRESERLNNIISDFLLYSREKNYVFVRHDLLQLLEETLTLLENHPQADQVEIVRDYSVACAAAQIDGNRMKQVFWNLCDNAMRAMPSGGILKVSVVAYRDGWQVIFKDSGIGLEPQHIEKIFEPFQSQFEGGTGLGLAVVYQIVQAHKGSIRVISKPREGAEFILVLPSADAHTETKGLELPRSRKFSPANRSKQRLVPASTEVRHG